MGAKLRALWIFLGAAVAPPAFFALGTALAGSSSDYAGIFVALSITVGLVSLSFIPVSWGWKALIWFLYIPAMAGAFFLIGIAFACAPGHSCF